jgi:hypothetical protein
LVCSLTGFFQDIGVLVKEQEFFEKANRNEITGFERQKRIASLFELEFKPVYYKSFNGWEYKFQFEDNPNSNVYVGSYGDIVLRIKEKQKDLEEEYNQFNSNLHFLVCINRGD